MVIEFCVVQFWSEMIVVTSNRKRSARSFNFEITRMISNQIALMTKQSRSLGSSAGRLLQGVLARFMFYFFYCEYPGHSKSSFPFYPLLYVMYTSPVADIIKSHDLQYHFYADDTQLYITFKTDSADDACLAKSRVEHCVEEIDRWMISNKLKLNDDKTELIVFSSKFRPRPCLSNVQIGSECIEHSNTVRNLGVLFDQTLSFGEHVSKLCDHLITILEILARSENIQMKILLRRQSMHLFHQSWTTVMLYLLDFQNTNRQTSVSTKYCSSHYNFYL